MPRVPAKFNKDDYCTPPEVLALVYAAIGIPDLDPCSNERSLVVSKHAMTKTVDGLTAVWEARTMFLNPPYSNTSVWVERFIEWWKCSGDREGVMLLSAETGLVWWQDELLPVIGRVGRWIFLPRIAFLANGKPIKGNRCNSVLIYVGQRDKAKLVTRTWPKPVFRGCG